MQTKSKKIAYYQLGRLRVPDYLPGILAAIFLLFCIIQPFYKLGALICAHTFLSAVAALVVLPAVLVVMPDRSVSPAPVDDSEATAVDVPTTEAFELPGLGPAATDATLATAPNTRRCPTACRTTWRRARRAAGGRWRRRRRR